MKPYRICVPVLGAVLALCAPSLAAQGWEASTQASGWAKQDKDDSFTFYVPATRTLNTWMQDGGLMQSIPLAKLEGAPNRWVIDPRNNAWVAHGLTLTQFDRNGGKITSTKLPAVVGDICWDTKGFVLSYRSPEPYLEKRDYKGNVMWSFGAKPPRENDETPAPRNVRPIVMNDAGHVLMADGSSLNLSILDGETGKKINETKFLLPLGQPPLPLEGPVTERDSIALWAGKGVTFAALKASQIPSLLRGSLQGRVLARLDLNTSQIEFLPTGLEDGFQLVGVLGSNALFVSPKGGLMQVQVH
ncbi:MAG TPA: hypothetical protein VJ486_07925 [Geothrix sp.]|nr:hypothetical protein [Geothrix sp.]